MRLFLLLCVLVAVVSGRPQELASEDEVELIAPVANDEVVVDGEKDPVVLVLRLPGFGGGDRDGGQGFPGFSGFPGLGGAADFPFTGLLGGNNRPKIPQIPQDPFNLFDDIFSGVANIPRDDVVEDGEVELIDPVDTNTPMRPGCGLLCTMFGIFQGLQDEIDVISDEIHGGGNGGGPFDGNGGMFGGNGDHDGMFGGNGGMFGGNGGNGGIFSGFPGIPGLPGYPEQEYDVNNSTYEEKVLEDGTKVAINKTVFADTDDNGNTFFVQTTFTQNVNTKLPALPPTQEADQEPVLPVEDFDEEVDNVDYEVADENIYDADSNADDADYEEADRNEYDAVNNADDADDADYETVDEDSIELPNEDPTINEIDDGIDQGLKE